MRYIASVHLRGFYIASLWGTASDEIRAVSHQKRVLDADSAALARGIRVGMAVSEAKAIVAGEGRFVPFTEEPFREAQSFWLDVCADHTDTIDPVGMHSALLDLSGHPDPRFALQRLCEALGAATGLSVGCGLAECRWVAEAAAVHGDPLGMALRDPGAYVSSLPTAEMPLGDETKARLMALGYKKVGQVASLRRSTLRTQFGAEAEAIHRYARGGGEFRVEPLYPCGAMAGRFHYEGATESRQALDEGIERLAEDLGGRLQEAAKVGENLLLILEHESGPATRCSRRFAHPISSCGSLRNAIRLLLPSETPPVTCIRARLSDLRDSEHVQLEIEGQRSPSDAPRGVNEAIRHLQAAFGDGAVKLASELQEPRWLAVRRAWTRVNGWNWA